MVELGEIVLWETHHFSSQAKAFLAARGATVTTCHGLEDLPPPGHGRWQKASFVVDVEEAGPQGISLLREHALVVVLTGRPSHARQVLLLAHEAGWEALVKPYTPEELYFRLNRLWGQNPWSLAEVRGEGAAALLVDAVRKLVGCRYVQMAEVREGRSTTVAECGDLSGAALVARILGSMGAHEALARDRPTVLTERLPSTKFGEDSGHAAVAIPLSGSRTAGKYLFLVFGLDGFPPGAFEARRVDALWQLLRAMGSGVEANRNVVSRLLAHIPSGIMVLDGEGRVFSLNRQGARLLGVSEQEAVGRHVAEVMGLAPDAPLARLVASPKGSARTEQEVRLPSGKTMLLGVTVVPVEAEAEMGAGSVVVFYNLGRLRRLEEKVRRADQLASLGAMAAGMAHEIRNPLASVLTSVQILGSLLPQDPRAKRYTETIVQQITRVNRIVQDLLTLGRPAKPRIEPCPIEKPIRDALQALGTRATDAGVSVRVDIPHPSPVALGDEAQLQQVFLNLFLNAVEAMPHGGTLSVRVAERADSGVVRVEVVDTGEGISQENLAHVFTPFFSTKAQGSGLGLSICNRIVSDHGGQMEISSVPGVGTTVAVEIPSAAQGAPHPVAEEAAGDEGIWENLVHL